MVPPIRIHNFHSLRKFTIGWFWPNTLIFMGFPPYESVGLQGSEIRHFSEEIENRNSIVVKTPVRRELNLCCFGEDGAGGWVFFIRSNEGIHTPLLTIS